MGKKRFCAAPILVKFQEMARVTGLEPATSGVTGRRSNQLSYTRFVAVKALYAGTDHLSTEQKRFLKNI
jgi:hypothetical protein